MSYRRMTPARPIGAMYKGTTQARVNARINPRNWALAFVNAVLGMNEYKDTEYTWSRMFRVVDVAGNGRYVKLVRMLDGGNDWGMPKWHESRLFYRAFDSLDLYKGQLHIRAMENELKQLRLDQQRNKEQELILLSRNTVTRALVHANSHDYCSETAVALVSAGHKLPDVTLSFKVVMHVDVTLAGNANYYPLRSLFGATDGEVEGASGMEDYITEHSSVHDAIREAVIEQGYDRWSTELTHTNTSVDWKVPVLRQLSNSEANREVVR